MKKAKRKDRERQASVKRMHHRASIRKAAERKAQANNAVNTQS